MLFSTLQTSDIEAFLIIIGLRLILDICVASIILIKGIYRYLNRGFLLNNILKPKCTSIIAL